MTVAHDTDVQAAAFDENLCDFGACIPQPGTSVKLQTLSDRIMFRAQYRNFGNWSDDRHQPLGRRRQRSRRGALVPHGEAGQRRLGHARPGHVRAD